jgi:hypothetical protein
MSCRRVAQQFMHKLDVGLVCLGSVTLIAGNNQVMSSIHTASRPRDAMVQSGA